ncbi:Protein kinase-like domain containing protein [Rhypophila decipiens]
MADFHSPAESGPQPVTTATTSGSTAPTHPPNIDASIGATHNKPSLPPNFKGIKFTRLKGPHDLPLNLRLRIQASKYISLDSQKNRSSDTIIPLGKTQILKLNTRRNELEAMEFVRANTSIPVPRVYEVYDFPSSSPSSSSKAKKDKQEVGDNIHLLMERLPNVPETWTSMTPEQVRSFGVQLADYLTQLRSLSPPQAPTSSSPLICSVTGGPVYDHRAGHTPFGPFPSISKFHAYLRLGCQPQEWTLDPIVTHIHSDSTSQRYSVKFTHADLNPSNICVSPTGQITGMIDWEFSGFYPEYWEYTKMYFAEGSPAYGRFFEAVHGEDKIAKYEDELKAERNIWRGISPWRYDEYYADHPEDRGGGEGTEGQKCSDGGVGNAAASSG